MPRRKTGLQRLVNFNTDKILSSSRSYTSLMYGALTVVILFVIVLFGIRVISQRIGTVGDQGIQTSGNQEGIYIVKAGDTLWSIAQDNYGDGQMWTEIAKINALSDPRVIEPGTKLVLPKKTDLSINIPLTITPTLADRPTVKSTLTPSVDISSIGTKITGNTYTVVIGDNLWNIAVRAYGDGFKWTEIAKANKLANPHLIHRGNKFTIPR